VELLQLQRQAAEIESELLGASETGSALADRVRRTTLQSPVKGVIKRLHINTVGGVVKPGSDIVEIVPHDDALLIEAEIRPSDIAHIGVGQKARVKFSAYDFAIHGSLDGEVNFVGADTVTNDKGESFYIVRIRPHRTFLGTDASPLPVKVGMTAEVDILTGKRTILQYLMKPIFKAKDNALQER
jgi:adhesin transport system membrane fusion protein